MKKKIISSFALFIMNTSLFALTNPEHSTTQYFEKIKNDPQQLLLFLQDMPKGGDLHNHHGGATMAENMIRYSVGDHMCLDKKTLSVTINTQCSPENYLENSLRDSALYNSIIDAWSMRFFVPGRESGHDHFFATFGKFYPIVDAHSAEILAEIVERAGAQNESYLELLMTSENGAVITLANQIDWDGNLTLMREKLLAAGLGNIVRTISKNFNADETKLKNILACGTKNEKPGCDVKIRYVYLTLREQPPAQVYAQLVAGFELANKDVRFVGINMVQPEDGILSMQDYRLHMQMVSFLHELYPNVHITLHAGELTQGLVPPEGLRFHIRDAVEIAHAERIGHGIDIAYEQNAEQLLNEMAKKNIDVEINLSSNADILGVKGNDHPLPLYLRYHVPVTLSTDDEGVLRSNMTEQYLKAILTYHFSYATVKEIVRNSISYSFLPGKNLWEDQEHHRVVTACAKDTLGDTKYSASCQAFLNTNEKARLQWDLESRFMLFEKKYAFINNIKITLA